MNRVNEIEHILNLWKHQEESFVLLSRRMMSHMKTMIRKHSQSTGGFSKKCKGKKRVGGGKRGTRKQVTVPNQTFWMVFLLFWGHLVQSHIIANRYLGSPNPNSHAAVPFKQSTAMSVMQMYIPHIVNQFDNQSKQIHDMKSIIDLINQQYIDTVSMEKHNSPFEMQEDCDAIFVDKKVQNIYQQRETTKRSKQLEEDGFFDKETFDVNVYPSELELSDDDKRQLRQNSRQFCSRSIAAPRMKMEKTSEGIQVSLHVTQGGSYQALEQELRQIVTTLDEDKDKVVILKIKKMLFMLEKIEAIVDSYHNEGNDFTKILHTSWKILDYYIIFHKIRVDYTSPQELIDMNEELGVQAAKDRMTMIQANANRNTAYSNSQYVLAAPVGVLQGTATSMGDVVETVGTQAARGPAALLNAFFYESAGALCGLASLLFLYKWSFKKDSNNNKQLQLENQELKKENKALTAMVTQLNTHLAIMPEAHSSALPAIMPAPSSPLPAIMPAPSSPPPAVMPTPSSPSPSPSPPKSSRGTSKKKTSSPKPSKTSSKKKQTTENPSDL